MPSKIKLTYVGSEQCPACPQVYKMLTARNVKFDAELDLSKESDRVKAAELNVRSSLPQVVVELGGGAGKMYLGPDVRTICSGLRDCGLAV